MEPAAGRRALDEPCGIDDRPRLVVDEGAAAGTKKTELRFCVVLRLRRCAPPLRMTLFELRCYVVLRLRRGAPPLRLTLFELRCYVVLRLRRCAPPLRMTLLRIEAAQLRRLGDARYGDAVRSFSHRDAVTLRLLERLAEGARHFALELIVDLVFFPEVCGEVLNPLEIGNGHAAGIGENVGQHHNA